MIMPIGVLMEVVLSMFMYHHQHLMKSGAVKVNILVIPNCNGLLGVALVLFSRFLADLKYVLLIGIHLVLVRLQAETTTIMYNVVDWMVDKVLRANDPRDPSNSTAMSKN